MTTYDETVSGLAKLETFDARAFSGGAACPQQLCDLVLGLALVYNDLRDVVLAQTVLESVTPDDTQTPTPALGNFTGVLPTQIHDLVARGLPLRVAGQTALTGLEELLGPGVIQIRADAFATAELADAFLALEALEYDADLLFG